MVLAAHWYSVDIESITSHVRVTREGLTTCFTSVRKLNLANSSCRTVPVAVAFQTTDARLQYRADADVVRMGRGREVFAKLYEKIKTQSPARVKFGNLDESTLTYLHHPCSRHALG